MLAGGLLGGRLAASTDETESRLKVVHSLDVVVEKSETGGLASSKVCAEIEERKKLRLRLHMGEIIQENHRKEIECEMGRRREGEHYKGEQTSSAWRVESDIHLYLFAHAAITGGLGGLHWMLSRLSGDSHRTSGTKYRVDRAYRYHGWGGWMDAIHNGCQGDCRSDGQRVVRTRAESPLANTRAYFAA